MWSASWRLVTLSSTAVSGRGVKSTAKSQVRRAGWKSTYHSMGGNLHSPASLRDAALGSAPRWG